MFCMWILWWKYYVSLWWKHQMPETPIGKDIDTLLTHGRMHKWWVADWKCTNFAQMMLLLGSDNWKLLFVHFSKVVLTTSWRSWRPDPNIRTHKKGWWQIWLFCVPYNQRKSQVWLEMNADALTKTANEWDTLRYSVGRRWGEKYFHFWLNTIWESYLGLYLSEMDIFEKFQLWAKYSFAMGWTEPWLIFLKVRSLQILCPLLTNSNKGLCWITTG